MIFGIGTDIVEVGRIEASLSQFGQTFAKRILTIDELVGFESSLTKARFLAKRFAAKEAFSKAFGTGLRGIVTFHNISVTHDALGKPLLAFSAELLALLNEKNILHQHISISDEKNLAAAFVILET